MWDVKPVMTMSVICYVRSSRPVVRTVSCRIQRVFRCDEWDSVLLPRIKTKTHMFVVHGFGWLVLMFVTVLRSCLVCTLYCTHKATLSFPPVNNNAGPLLHVADLMLIAHFKSGALFKWPWACCYKLCCWLAVITRAINSPKGNKGTRLLMKSVPNRARRKGTLKATKALCASFACALLRLGVVTATGFTRMTVITGMTIRG